MNFARLLPLAGLALAIACNDSGNTTTAPALDPSFDAGNGAHFQRSSATFSGADLTIKFTEAGLGNSPQGGLVHVEATGSGIAEYACLNGGGKHPQAANKEDVNGPVAASGDFPIGKNGSVSGTLTLSPPPSTLKCPGGQTFVLASVTYDNVSISDLTNSVTGFAVAGGGPFSKTFFSF